MDGKNIVPPENCSSTKRYMDKFDSASYFWQRLATKFYQFVDFVEYIYEFWWFTEGIPQDAAANDLNLWWKTLKHPNEIASTSVMQSFSRHI